MMKLLHRLWRCVPHGLRRSVFDHASLVAAPRAGPVPALPPDAPICVVGAFQAPTGLAEAARLTALGLTRAGFATQIADVTNLLRQPALVAPPALPPITVGPGLLLVFGNPPVTSYVLARLGRPALKDKFRVGCWVWEYADLPERWSAHAERFHMLAAPNAFVAKAIRSSVPASDLALLPYPLDPNAVRPVATRSSILSRFRIGFIFDLGNDTGRKNPEALIAAVARAFPRDPSVEVVFTVSTGGDGHPRLKQLTALAHELGVNLQIDILAKDRHHHLARFTSIDAYVSLHRAEGFGLTLAEAIQSGVPLVATRAAPVTEYLSDANSYLVDASAVLAPALLETQSPGVWHDVDLQSAAEQLRKLRADPTEARARAAKAQCDLMRLYGPDAFQAAAEALVAHAAGSRNVA